MKSRTQTIISVILIVTAAAALTVFGTLNIAYTDDKTFNALLNGIIPRLIAGGALIGLAVILGCKKILTPHLKKLPKHLLWCVPCFLVVLANFPFTAIFGGSAKIEHPALIPLFILECLATGLMEEILFRGLMQDTLRQVFENKPHEKVLTVLATSAIFGLLHLLNLFAGANVGATFLQVAYSFLIGAMLSAVLIKTENLWLCVIFHAAFNFGGNIVTELGAGAFQDMWFWLFTAVAGVICAGHVIYFLFKKQPAPVEQ